jgi:hypothetical protein
MPSSGMWRRVALVRFLQEPHGVTSLKTEFLICKTFQEFTVCEL